MVDAIDKKIIHVLQNGIPVVAEPFAALAKEVGIPTEDFLARLRRLKEEGILRRMGAVLQHRHAGFKANVLCIWKVPEEWLDEVGKIISAESFVSHCYTRSTTPEWPYNLYTMIHGHTKEQCDEIAERIASENNLTERKMLYTVREWKKASMRYFEE